MARSAVDSRIVRWRGSGRDRLVAEAAGDLAGEYILHLSNRDFWPDRVPSKCILIIRESASEESYDFVSPTFD
jgi:hypothetical protein